MTIGGLNAPPYVYVDEDGNASGILVDKVRIALRHMDISPEFRISNWARAYHDAKVGTIDALLPTIKTEDREVDLVFPAEPLATFRMTLIHPRRDGVHQPKIEDLKGKRVGKIREAKVAKQFDELAEKEFFKVEQRGSFGLLALGVSNQRLDFAAGPELMLLWAAGENGVLDRISSSQLELAQVPVYLAISKNSQFSGQSEAIANALRATVNSEAFQNALNPYSKFLNIDLYEKLKRSTY